MLFRGIWLPVFSAILGWSTWSGESLANIRATDPSTRADASQRYFARVLNAERYSLPNGLTVILHQDHSLPLVSVNVWYRVGPAYEPPRRSGFAHLFEHLMFGGSKHVGRDFDRIMEAAGATNVNGTTEFDRTNYFATVPREYLELVLWIESDRMGFMLDGLTPERLEVEREVVSNERRQSFEDAPYGPSLLTLLNSLFPEGHPYHGAVIGSLDDIARATLADVRSFFLSHYTPSNATLTIAGDFDREIARSLIQKYFADLPDRPRAPRPVPPSVPVAAGRRIVPEPVKLAQVAVGWRTPPAFSADDAALHIASALLVGGKASSLNRKLVLEDKVATQIGGGFDAYELAGTFTLFMTVASGVRPEKLERSLHDVLSELARKGPSPTELARAKHRTLFYLMSNLERLNGVEGDTGRAGILQYLNHYVGDPGFFARWVEQIRSVTEKDVARVIKAHLLEGPQVTVVTEPQHSPED